MASRRRAPQPCATTDAGIIERPYANPLSRVPSASWERRFFRGICSLLSWPLLPDVENAMLAPSQGHEHAKTGRATQEGRLTLIKRMDHVSVVVDDLEAAKAFFIELGMELEGEAPIEGREVDRLNGLDGIRVDIAMMRTPDGHGRLELTKFHSPQAAALSRRTHWGTRWACAASCSPSTTSTPQSPACEPTVRNSSERWRSTR